MRFVLLVATLLGIPVLAQAQFSGFEDSSLDPVTDTLGDWGLKIVVFDAGQADAILVMAPNGDVALIDSGSKADTAHVIVDFLSSPTLNVVGELRTIDLHYATHYDSDHIRGLFTIVNDGIAIRKAYDQGPSGKRSLTTSSGNATVYSRYVAAVGDPDGNGAQGPDENQFVRRRAHPGDLELIGLNDEIEILTLAVRGDTTGDAHDLDLDPTDASSSFDENPGSITLLIRLGEFELYAAGDQTDDDWKSKPPVEDSVLDSGAIPGGNDIDVLKVSHHGSDTSTSNQLSVQLDPEVAIISTKFSGAKLPKQVVLKQFQENRSFVLITGDGHNPDGTFQKSSATDEDDDFEPDDEAIFNDEGRIMVLVSPDGSRYSVVGASFLETFSAVDDDNQR